MNKVQLIGRVGTDPTVHEYGEDKKVVNYTVATSETRPDKEGKLTLIFSRQCCVQLKLIQIVVRKLDQENSMAPCNFLEFGSLASRKGQEGVNAATIV